MSNADKSTNKKDETIPGGLNAGKAEHFAKGDGKLTHVDEHGEVRMVDVSDKDITKRQAIAEGWIFMHQDTLDAITDGKIAKGDVLACARVAAIMGCKQTSAIIPMCHPLNITKSACELESVQADEHPSGRVGIHASMTCGVNGKTGIEMEALTGVSVALLTIYDMCKAIDRGMEICDVRLVRKEGGRTGVWTREQKRRFVMDVKFYIITCSSTRSFEEDTAGARLEELIAEQGWSLIERVVVKDDVDQIANAIEAGYDAGADIILTCGGSGMSLADVTPEATRKVCDREVPGVAEAMRAYSMTKTHRAMLSRAIVMQKGCCTVVNLPGSKKAAEENWEGVYDQFEHMKQMMAGAGH